MNGSVGITFANGTIVSATGMAVPMAVSGAGGVPPIVAQAVRNNFSSSRSC
jgi:hypothetical protein